MLRALTKRDSASSNGGSHQRGWESGREDTKQRLEAPGIQQYNYNEKYNNDRDIHSGVEESIKKKHTARW